MKSNKKSKLPASESQSSKEGKRELEFPRAALKPPLRTTVSLALSTIAGTVFQVVERTAFPRTHPYLSRSIR
jgi:hypothetical protein